MSDVKGNVTCLQVIPCIVDLTHNKCAVICLSKCTTGDGLTPEVAVVWMDEPGPDSAGCRMSLSLREVG